jgi:hypothetical protein
MLKLFSLLENKRVLYQRRITVSQIEMLEQNVKQLSPSELSAFRAWFMEFDAAQWDRQLETDSETGKLDRLAQSALEEHRAGKTKLI